MIYKQVKDLQDYKVYVYGRCKHVKTNNVLHFYGTNNRAKIVTGYSGCFYEAASSGTKRVLVG